MNRITSLLAKRREVSEAKRQELSLSFGEQDALDVMS